jgi:hypothetical protein
MLIKLKLNLIINYKNIKIIKILHSDWVAEKLETVDALTDDA